MSSTFYTSNDVSRRKNCQYVIARLRNSCNHFSKMYRRNHRKCRSSHRKCSEKKGVLKKFNKLHRKIPVLESLFNTVAGLQPASFLKRDSNMCFPVKYTKVLRTSILKNICERLLLEMFYKKAVLKNFAIFIGRKQLVIKCSVKKVFLVVDRAVKVTCFYIDQHLLYKKQLAKRAVLSYVKCSI